MQSAPLWLMNPTLPGRAIAAGERGVQPAERAHHAQAVRPDQPHPAAPGLLEDPALELGPVRPDLLEPGRDHDRALDAGVGALGRSRPGTVAAGVTTTARSTGSGTSAIVGYALIPSTLGRFGLTG